jgi:putative transposase
MKRTFKYRLYPTKKQKEKFEQTFSVCRSLYNSCLLDRKNHYERTGKGLTYNDQASILVRDKESFPQLANIHSQVLQDVLKRADKSFKNFFRRVKAGETSGYPRLKSESRYDSFTYPQSGFGIEDGRLKLSKIGDIKIKIHRSIKGIVKTCTIKREIDRWYACFSVELPESEKKPIKTVTGIDAGFRKVVTLSDGDTVENPAYYRKALDKLRIVQKSLSRKVKGSNNRRKQRIVVAKLHRKVAAKRRDFLHKLSRNLVNTYDLISIENLNLNRMIQGNKYIRKPLYDTGWGYLKNMLSYKAEEAGKRVIKVDPSQTSKICSNCGEPMPKSISMRRHRCHSCGLVIDRDHNAAINILRVGTALCGDLTAIPPDVLAG